ncbi:MAG: hypothetical protein QNK05_07730 [Myxococcota bacterium]|nr:hypothetical protein [Myxococcota bacterium]
MRACLVGLLLALAPLVSGCVIQLEGGRFVQPWETEQPQPTAIFECRGASGQTADRSCLRSHGYGPDTKAYVPYAP